MPNETIYPYPKDDDGNLLSFDDQPALNQFQRQSIDRLSQDGLISPVADAADLQTRHKGWTDYLDEFLSQENTPMVLFSLAQSLASPLKAGETPFSKLISGVAGSAQMAAQLGAQKATAAREERKFGLEERRVAAEEEGVKIKREAVSGPLAQQELETRKQEMEARREIAKLGLDEVKLRHDIARTRGDKNETAKIIMGSATELVTRSLRPMGFGEALDSVFLGLYPNEKERERARAEFVSALVGRSSVTASGPAPAPAAIAAPPVAPPPAPPVGARTTMPTVEQAQGVVDADGSMPGGKIVGQFNRSSGPVFRVQLSDGTSRDIPVEAIQRRMNAGAQQ